MTTPEQSGSEERAPREGAAAPEQPAPKDEPAASERTSTSADTPAADPSAPDAPPAQDLVPDEVTASPDRVFRSGAGIAGGVLLLALVAWLGIDAVLRGQGRGPWVALASMLLLVPLVSSFTVRPAVYANDQRLRVRNPFRTITLPWATVSGLRSGYSNEVLDQSGAKYQLWAIPVSLRARKKAGREQLRAASDDGRQGSGTFGSARSRGLSGAFGGGFGGLGGATQGQPSASEPVRAPADRVMEDLRELAANQADVPAAQGEPEVRWAYEVIGPTLAGAALLVVLLGVG